MNFKYRTDKNAQAIAAYWKKPLDVKSEYFSVKNDESSAEAEIIIFDYIGWPYNDPRELISALDNLGGKDVVARINSQGGDAFDGLAIHNAFKGYKGKVTTRIEALAASAASIIALGATKEVQAYKNSMFMIHEPLVVAFGNQHDLRSAADILEKINNNMVEIYTDKSGLGKKEIREMVKSESWFTAKEAKNKGFIDTIIDGKGAKAEFDLSIFANYPSNISDDPDNPAILTSFDVERILRDAKAPKAFAKAVAAACRTAGLFDRCQADDKPNGNDDKVIDSNKPNAISNLSEITSLLNGAISTLNK